jgi:hypothetical protein
MATSAAGTVYATGLADDASETPHVLVQQSVDGGSTWSLVNDSTGVITGVQVSIAVDPGGVLYQAATAKAPGATWGTWVTRQSTDGGANWTIVDNFTLGGEMQPWSVTTDAAGNVYVAGYGTATSAGNLAWLVRKGTPTAGGMTWTTVDQFVTSGTLSKALGVVSHPTAGIFVIGLGQVTQKSVSASVWIVRRSQDDGATWTTVDTYEPSSEGRGVALGVDGAGNLYGLGYVQNSAKGVFFDWYVRKSSDGGSTWTTVDHFSTSGTSNFPEAFASDAKGNLYVAGYSSNSTTGDTWIVRESVGGTGAWTTVDSYQLDSGKSAVAFGIVSAMGEVLAGGYGADATAQHWIVRRFTP